jgi:PAS domain S-box-containing protein
MNIITKVILENEMDLILAHKQSMRLAELTGLSLPAQTTFATAVSEVSRNAIMSGNAASLQLYVSNAKEKTNFITAILEDARKSISPQKDEGYNYAKKLVSDIKMVATENGTTIELHYQLPPAVRIDDSLVEKWRINLNTDPTISPYEEIKRKNRQLVEMADKLRASEQQYKSLTDSLPIMIFSLTTAGDITYANNWFYEYTGETLDSINNSEWRNIVHADDLPEAWATWQTHVAKAASIPGSERRIKNAATGEYRWHTGISTPVLEEDGTVKCWNTYMVDIHAQRVVQDALKDNVQLRKVQAELQEKVVLLDQSNQQLEQFAYVASHDLQEPLRKIALYSDFLKTRHWKDLTPESGAIFDNIVSATERMKVLITDILSYSIVRADKQKFTVVDLNDIAAAAIRDLDISIQATGGAISYDKLPFIEGNVAQLKQLFENLISNSLKYTAEGVAPKIQIGAVTEGDMVILSFKDNGIGFETAFLHKIFNLFQRLHSRDKYEGTGIGLALCKKIVEIHNGSITAESEPGKGADFIIRLPMHRVAQ